MSAPAEILRLVQQFDDNADDYRAAGYNETQARQEFINPFFRALGWDVDNSQGHAEAYKDVIHEGAIKVGGVTKAPDYCYRIGGTRKFFLEAKKPGVNIKDDPTPAYQLRRYAWSAKLPLSILTDFEEFSVYDCRVKPAQTDKASAARLMYLTYREYEQRWDEIAGIFSREAVLKGSFDKYAETYKGKRGTATVDKAILQEIESWREMLAKNLALRNLKLSQRELNYAVQVTIDRIIFLRMCEDRGIESYGQLQAHLNGTSTYGRLKQLFHHADDRYNSGLFHFQKEKDRPEAPDELTPGLMIDDKPLKEIISGLYYPESPYEFSVLPAEILGQVYEQFLGKVIRLTQSHHAKVEDKPEVKKAGGVYYTPSYIVDYIVKHTVGRLLSRDREGAEAAPLANARGSEITPKQAAKLRILDPACGSGSFLLGAYQYLLDWHRDWYLADGAAKHTKEIFEGAGGVWRLTTAEKKRILLNNVYGVDIDPQAVEVTKLSLLLKMLEGESKETIDRQLKFLHERALPDLAGNIKCGNSLIGPDFYDGQQMTMFDEDERYRINVFDWNAAFPAIMKAGGFDAVIGNPPYVDIKTLPESDVEYLFKTYESANNRINLFAAFVERSLRIVGKRRFRFSMIVPTAVLSQDSYKALRQLVIEHYQIDSIVRLPNESFGAAAGDVKVDTVILVFQERGNEAAAVSIIAYSGYERISRIDEASASVRATIQQESWIKAPDCVWAVNTGTRDEAVLQRCLQGSVPLESCVEFSLGLTPYDKYKGHTESQIQNKVFHANRKKDDTYKKLLAGNDVMRYMVSWNGEQWIKYGPSLGAAREPRFFTTKRIVVKQIIDWTTRRIWAAITADELYNTQNAFNLLSKANCALEYLLGILNSRLMTFYHRKRFLDEFKMRFQKILIKDCRRLPIHVIDSKNRKETAAHDRIVAFVQRMQTLYSQLAVAKTPHEKTVLQTQIAATDREIDRLVYELYGLTEEEIRIVEESAEPNARTQGE